MKKIVNVLTLIGFGLLSFIGLTGNSIAAPVPSISKVTETSPLYLKKVISSQQQVVKNITMLAQHYSHESHYSHSSHSSHYSHYSGR
jgi:hypothetical protein